MAEFFGNELSRIGVDKIAGLHHLAFLHQEFDDVDGTLGHTLSELLYGDRFRQNDFTSDFLAGFLLHAALELLLAAAHGRKRTAAAFIIERRAQCQLATAAFILALDDLGCADFRLGRCCTATTTCADRTTTILVFFRQVWLADRCLQCGRVVGCLQFGLALAGLFFRTLFRLGFLANALFFLGLTAGRIFTLLRAQRFFFRTARCFNSGLGAILGVTGL